MKDIRVLIMDKRFREKVQFKKFNNASLVEVLGLEIGIVDAFMSGQIKKMKVWYSHKRLVSRLDAYGYENIFNVD